MALVFAWPNELTHTDSGVALTFIVPASDCDLRCAHCAIRQRSETSDHKLTPEDYSYFLADVVAHVPSAIASIQGYEPLLPESWEYTFQILQAAKRCSIRSSLVTNGTNLEQRAADLAALTPAGITVSLDASSPDAHDQLRGKSGSFERTVQGIMTFGALPGCSKKLTVSSVLMPGRRHLLEDMPALLAKLGVQHWVVNPLLRVGRLQVGGTVARSSEVIADLLVLGDIATRHGIRLTLDDELGTLSSQGQDYNTFIIRRFARPDGLLRLTPSGACSVGTEILRKVDESTPVWDPKTVRPSDFVRSLLAKDLVSERSISLVA